MTPKIIATSLLSFALIAAATICANAQELQPLSPEAAQRVEKLLEAFDPGGYSLDIAVVDASGRVSHKRLGKAVGLSSEPSPGREIAAASTNVNNNVFKVASTNVNNNIFRIAST